MSVKVEEPVMAAPTDPTADSSAGAPTSVSREKMRELSGLSPFELERKQTEIAHHTSLTTGKPVLSAGRGNPNWNAAAPREAFFALGHFAIAESRRVWTADSLGGMPTADGAHKRFEAFVNANPGMPGIVLLRDCVEYGIRQLGFEPDPWVHELADAVLGDNYPFPDRVLTHCEQVVRAYLAAEMADGRPPAGNFNIFPTEGGTAAMCYLFDSLENNRILGRGDKVALMTPLFPPYLEIPRLDRYQFEVVSIAATPNNPDNPHSWYYSAEQMEQLADPAIKAVFMVNPSNPPSYDLSDEARNKILDIIRGPNPDLIILTDDVYGTFVPGFQSLAAIAPHNTLLVYSYSKHYGCTGWRLGVIAVHEDNVVDKLIARLPEDDKAAIRRRYESLSLDPDSIPFIDRLVADSRQVALHHTSGLSCPQQAQLMLFSLFDLQEVGQEYKLLLREIVHRRLELLAEGGDFTFAEDPKRAGYYVDIDILTAVRREYGDEFAKYLEQAYEPADILFRLAEQHAVVLINGRGFDGPAWTVRVSLANLNDLDYLKIGHDLRSVLNEYLAEWKSAKGT